MLAGERAAGVDAGDEDRLGQLGARSASPVDVLVVEDERMEVAVAGMEDIADAEAVLALELGDPAQHLGQLRPRDDAVLDVVVGLTRPIAANADLRPFQSSARSCASAAVRISHAPLLAADASTRGQVLLDLRGDAVELDDQDRPGVVG